MSKYEHSLHFMVDRIFELHFLDVGQKYLRGRLVDIGCGEKPLKKLLENIVDEHIGVDHYETIHNKSQIDLFGTAYNIPVSNCGFDSAICTAVLEHLEEPELAIKECYRILKPGGYAIYSVPFIWHLHEEPRDFYRFSKYGLKYLFEKVGFSIVEIRPLSGFLITFLQLHLYVLDGKVNKGLIKTLGLFKLYSIICSRIALKINKYDNSSLWTWMNIIVVKK